MPLNEYENADKHPPPRMINGKETEQMSKRTTRVWIIPLLFLTLFGVMGGDCDINIPSIPLPDPNPVDPLVTVELVNTTDFFVDPFIYVHPDEAVPFSVLTRDENLIVLDPPELEPGEIVELDFECVDIGAVITDRPLLLDGDVAFESTNSPLLRWATDYECGDLVSFVYVDDLDTGEFFVQAEVNGFIVAD